MLMIGHYGRTKYSTSWLTSMRSKSLKVRALNLLYFPPSQRKAQNETLTKWLKAEASAKIVISQCVGDELHQRISGHLSAKEAWDVLIQEFDSKAEDQSFRQCLNFFNVEWSENKDAPSVLARIKNQYCDLSAGLKTRKIESVDSLLELLFVSKVLHILLKRLRSFKLSYLMMKANDNKTIDDISSALILHERNVAPVSISSSSGEVLEACGVKGKFFQKTNKPAPNHSSEGDNKNSDVVCKYCGNKGHWLKQCLHWRVDGEPPYPARAGGKSLVLKPSATVSETDTKMALATVSSDVFSASTNDRWWVDNGATKHITNNFNWFTMYEPFANKSTVTVAGKEVLRDHGSGTM